MRGAQWFSHLLFSDFLDFASCMFVTVEWTEQVYIWDKDKPNKYNMSFLKEDFIYPNLPGPVWKTTAP